MKKKLSMLLAVCTLMTAFSLPAHALEYEFDAPSAGLFGRPTSDETIYIGVNESVNIDRSKSAALISPIFGSPASYTLNAGEYLTPNLVTGQTGSVSTGGVTVVPPSIGGSTGTDSSTSGSYWTPAYTAVTKDLYYCRSSWNAENPRHQPYREGLSGYGQHGIGQGRRAFLQHLHLERQCGLCRA